MEKRNSFAKTVYSMLFTWLVDRINTTIAPAETASLKGASTRPGVPWFACCTLICLFVLFIG